ncbi:MAG: hypothetical protein ACJA0Z_004418 [Halioglobus sp.]
MEVEVEIGVGLTLSLYNCIGRRDLILDHLGIFATTDKQKQATQQERYDYALCYYFSISVGTEKS